MSDDEEITRTQAEAWSRELLAETRRMLKEERAEEAAATSVPAAGTVSVSDREIRLGRLLERRADARPMSELEALRAVDDPDVVAEHAEAVAVERVRLQAVADGDVERARASTPEGREQRGELLLRQAERQAQQAERFRAVAIADGQILPDDVARMSDAEVIEFGQRVPGPPGKIERAMGPARRPERVVDDLATNLKAAGWTAEEES